MSNMSIRLWLQILKWWSGLSSSLFFRHICHFVVIIFFWWRHKLIFSKWTPAWTRMSFCWPNLVAATFFGKLLFVIRNWLKKKKRGKFSQLKGIVQFILEGNLYFFTPLFSHFLCFILSFFVDEQFTCFIDFFKHMITCVSSVSADDVYQFVSVTFFKYVLFYSNFCTFYA